MLKPITINELFTEIPEESWAVTIYISKEIHSKNEATERTKLKNRIHEIEKELKNKLSRRDLLRVKQELGSALEHLYWIPREGSTGFYISEKSSGYMTFPFKTEDKMVFANSFHLKPVLKWLYLNKRFYFLKLEDSIAELFIGDSFGMESIWKLSENGKSKKKSARFLEDINRSVLISLNEETIPLVLSANKEIQMQFREVCGYPYLLEDELYIIEALTDTIKIHSQVFEHVLKQYEKDVVRANESFNLASLIQKTSTDITEIGKAIVSGRVKNLFIAEDKTVIGKLDKKTGIVIVSKAGDKSDDLLDDLAEAAISYRSQIFVLPQSKMPTKYPIAATLRW